MFVTLQSPTFSQTNFIIFSDRRAVPARVTLSFTTLLSLSTLGNGLRIGLPQVSYAKALDLWFGVCMFFVFLNLLEFAVVNSYMRKAEKYEKMAKTVSERNKRGGVSCSVLIIHCDIAAARVNEEDESFDDNKVVYLYSQNGGPRRRVAESSLFY